MRLVARVEYRGRMVEAVEADFWQRESGGAVICLLCPRNCKIKPGDAGACGVRVNVGGKLFTINYGKITAAALDPIEKKPLYHFFPGETAFSIGTFGCNMFCPWCQNHEISRGDFSDLDIVPPEILVNRVRSSGHKIIAYTYSEPNVWFEYVKDCSKLASRMGIKNVLVTNGMLSEEALKEIVPFIDAANVDLKTFSQESYGKIGGKMENVLGFIKALKGHGVHVELTTLVVTGFNDDIKAFEMEVRWIATELGRDTPLHITRYFPMFKYHRPPTDLEVLEAFKKVAMGYLDFVYVGNVWGSSPTICPRCGAEVISRHGYNVVISGLDEGGNCRNCGYKIAVMG